MPGSNRWLVEPEKDDCNYQSEEEASQYLFESINSYHDEYGDRKWRKQDDPLRLDKKWIKLLLSRFPQLRRYENVEHFIAGWFKSGGVRYVLEQHSMHTNNVNHPYTLLKQPWAFDKLMKGEFKELYEKKVRDTYRASHSFEQAFAKSMGDDSFPGEENVAFQGIEEPTEEELIEACSGTYLPGTQSAQLLTDFEKHQWDSDVDKMASDYVEAGERKIAVDRIRRRLNVGHDNEPRRVDNNKSLTTERAGFEEVLRKVIPAGQRHS